MEPEAPRRITDLIAAKQAGATVAVSTVFDIVAADFQQRDNPFQAYIFMCRYTGHIDDQAFEFRKCYARGCPNNLCTHVSQAIQIANRYLQRDYSVLEKGGIHLPRRLFTLDDMVVKFDRLKEESTPGLVVDDLIAMARADQIHSLEIDLEYVPAVEHFAHYKNAQTFLNGDFVAQANAATHRCHRCFACYQTDHEADEKPMAIQIANERLKLIYDQFDKANVAYQQRFFV